MNITILSLNEYFIDMGSVNIDVTALLLAINWHPYNVIDLTHYLMGPQSTLRPAT